MLGSNEMNQNHFPKFEILSVMNLIYYLPLFKWLHFRMFASLRNKYKY